MYAGFGRVWRSPEPSTDAGVASVQQQGHEETWADVHPRRLVLSKKSSWSYACFSSAERLIRPLPTYWQYDRPIVPRLTVWSYVIARAIRT